MASANYPSHLTATEAFPDHHPYRTDEIARLRDIGARENAQLVTTAKDWARLRPELRDAIQVLDIEVRWRDPMVRDRVLDPFLALSADGRDARAARG